MNDPYCNEHKHEDPYGLHVTEESRWFDLLERLHPNLEKLERYEIYREVQPLFKTPEAYLEHLKASQGQQPQLNTSVVAM